MIKHGHKLGGSLWFLGICACSGGGGGSATGDDDASVDASTPDGGMIHPDGGDIDAGQDGSTGPGGDAGPDGGGGDPDAGDGGGPMSSCTGAGTTIARTTGGTVTSHDGLVSLDIAPNALSTDATVWLCSVAQQQWPAALDEQPVGPVYVLESTDASVTGALRVELSDALEATLSQGGQGLAPVLVRALPLSGGAAETLGEATLSLSDGTWTAAGVVSGQGYIYLRHLDQAGARYRVQLNPPGAPHLTGEVFDLEAKVSVVGTPQVTRSLEVEVTGCQLELIQPAGDSERAQAACGARETVLRSGGAIDSDYADGQLTAGRSFDLTAQGAAATHLPPRFYCTFPGAASAAVALHFVNGSDTELTVRAEQEVSCALSLDRIAAADLRVASKVQHGPLLVNTFPDGTPVHGTQVLVSNAATRALFRQEPDGAYRSDTTTQLQSLAPFASVRLASALNAVTVSHAASLYEEDGPYEQASPMFFDENASSSLTAEFPGEVELGVEAPGFASLALGFGAPAGWATRFSFADGSLDLVVVRGLDEAGNLRFERWLRPGSLPLDAGRRSSQFLGDEDEAEGVAEYRLELFNVTWDEDRTVWPGERVLPLLAGHVVRVRASALAAVASPCPETNVEDLASGCWAGPMQGLLVATEDGLELFDASDGSYLGPVFQDAGHTGFKQAVQGPDGCLYASRHQGTAGVYRYKPTASGIEAIDAANTPWVGLAQVQSQVSSFEPNGLAVLGDQLLIANGEGRVLAVASDGDVSTYVGDESWQAYGLALEKNSGLLMVSTQSGALGTHKIWAVPPPEIADPLEIEYGFFGPEQMTFDNPTEGLLLVAESATSPQGLAWAGVGGFALTEVAAYGFPSGQEPRGIWPLLTPGRWLVSGTNGLGVQVVNHEGTGASATPVGDFDDVETQYISHVCLPFAPSGS